MWAIGGIALVLTFFAAWGALVAIGFIDFFAATHPGAESQEPTWGYVRALLRRGGRFFSHLAALVLLVALVIFLLAPRDIKLIPGLLALLAAGVLASVRLRSEAERYTAAKRDEQSPMQGVRFSGSLRISCPRCGQRLRVARGKRGRVICPKCQPVMTFGVQPVIGPVLWTLGAVVGVWLVAVDPWDPGAPPLAVAMWSAICAGLCVITRPVLDQWRRLKETPELAWEAFDGAWIAFAVMSVTALGFAAANLTLPRLASVPIADMTVRQLLEFQSRVHELGERLEKTHLELWITGLALLALAISVRMGWMAVAARTSKTQKWAAKVLKVGSVSILSMSAFSLSGAVGTGTLQMQLSHTFQLDALSAPGLEHSVDQLEREIASRAIREALEAQQTAAANCGGAAAFPCAGPIIAALSSEASVAKDEADLWPRTSNGRPYGQNPAAELQPAAESVADALSVLRQTKANSKPTMSEYEGISATAAGNFNKEMAAEVQSPASESPLAARHHEIADLAVDLLFSLLPLDPSEMVKAGLGEFAAKLVGGLGDVVKSPFKVAAQGAAVRAMEACSTKAGCHEAVRREIAREQKDSRVAALAQAVVQSFRRPISRWTKLEDDLRMANTRTDRELRAMAEPGRRAEQAGEWGHFRARLIHARVLGQVSGEEGVDILRTEWPKAVYTAALHDAADPKLPAERWNKRFISFLISHPRAAAVVSYFVLKDPEARSALEQFAPDEPQPFMWTIRGIGEDELVAESKLSLSRLDRLDYDDVFLALVNATRTTDLYKALSYSNAEMFWDEFGRAGLPQTAKGKRKQDEAKVEAEQRRAAEHQRQEEIEHARAMEVHPAE